MTENKSEAKYPECEKMKAVQERSQELSDFLEWLGQQLIDLCELTDEHWFPIHTSREHLLANYFDIDLSKVEQEGRAILDEIREAQDGKAPPA